MTKTCSLLLLSLLACSSTARPTGDGGSAGTGGRSDAGADAIAGAGGDAGNLCPHVVGAADCASISGCRSSWAAVLANPICLPGTLDFSQEARFDCDGYHVSQVGHADSSETYYYGATTGDLVAIYRQNNLVRSCVAGPPSGINVDCPNETPVQICQRDADAGGSDGSACADSGTVGTIDGGSGGSTSLGSSSCTLAGADWCNQLAGVQQRPMMALAPDGALVVAGSTGPALGVFADLFVAKYAASGELAWIQQLGTAVGDELNGIAIDATGNIAVVGFSYQSASEDFVGTQEILAELSPSGEALWIERFDDCGQDKGLAVATNASNDLVTLGVGANGGYLVAFSPTGNLLWQTPVSSFSNNAVQNFPFEVDVDGSGDINVWNTTYGVTLAKFSPSGEPLDTVAAPNDGRIVVSDPNHDILAFIMGTASITRVDPASASVVWTAPLDAGFTPVRLALDASDNVYLAGYTGAPDSATYAAAYSSAGERLWSKSVSATNLSSIAAGTHGDVFVGAGTTIVHVVP